MQKIRMSLLEKAIDERTDGQFRKLLERATEDELRRALETGLAGDAKTARRSLLAIIDRK